MSGAIVVFVLWFVAVGALGALAIAHPPASRIRARVDPILRPVAAVIGSGIRDLGRLPTAVTVFLAGVGLVLTVCWPLGLVAHSLQGAVDWPVFHWFEARQVHGWSSLWLQLTNIGKPRVTQGVTALAGCAFALVWWLRRRRWWVPLLAFAATYALAKYCQIILEDVVHRGHPPTTLGTFPSGGCARVIMVYGLVIFMVVHTLRPHSQRLWTAGGVLLAFLWSVQAYARIYNLEHWITDVVGGTVFGLLGLGVMLACVHVYLRPEPRPTTAEADAGAAQPRGEVPWRLSAPT